jgi:hypothetical protein
MSYQQNRQRELWGYRAKTRIRTAYICDYALAPKRRAPACGRPCEYTPSGCDTFRVSPQFPGANLKGLARWGVILSDQKRDTFREKRL